MDYKDTLNLPKTDFSMKADLGKKEPEILKFWDKIHLYEKMREKNKGNPKYILHDGPPYANGHVHIGTALNKILKDIVIKYKTLRGYNTPYIPGWDCHGLPVEFQLFKELGISKNEIRQLEFRQKAKDYALHFIGVQREEFKRLGVFGDWEHPYLTLDPLYEAKIIEVFGQLAEQGYIYKDLKPVYWCATCETALAEAEVEYDNVQSPAIYVRFKITKDPSAIFPDGYQKWIAIWTTTPWTLPGNVAVAVSCNEDYTFLLDERNKDAYLVGIGSPAFKQDEATIKFETAFPNTVKGSDLENMEYKHPFLDRIGKIVCADFVTMKDGSGCVHIAPGHGEEDYSLVEKYNLPVISPVDDKGRLTKEAGIAVGKIVCSYSQKVSDSEADYEIINYLQENNFLISNWIGRTVLSSLHEPRWRSKASGLEHSYPHCWRCKNPVIFRATEQWFLDIDKNKLRQEILDEIKKVEWVPAIGRNRISAMMEVRPDWCLSRQRFWGVPLPIFYCKECGEPLMSKKSIKVVQELFGKEGSDAWFKYEAENILPKNVRCSKCKGDKFRKETDILDVWFDSGASYAAVVQTHQDLLFPSDLYLEGSDQHRGWFQHSLITAMGTLKKSPFKTVLTHGFVVDGEGKKMSKSLGNTIGPEEVINQGGADILRLWVSSQNYTEDIRISPEILDHLTDAYRKIRNTIRFLLGNLYDFKKEDRLSYQELLDVDRFMFSKLQKLIDEVTLSYEEFEYYRVFRLLYNFCTVDLSAFYLDISKDRLYTFKAKSRERLSAQTLIFEIAETVIKMLAPIISFTAEESWNYLRMGEESIFLSNWPRIRKECVDEKLEERWSKILALKESVNKELEAERKKSVIGNSLEAKVEIYTSDQKTSDFLNSDENAWKMVFIVSGFQLERVEKEDYAKIELMETNIEGLGSLKIRIVKAEGKKCSRCWNYSESVGLNAKYPELCERCVKQIK